MKDVSGITARYSAAQGVASIIVASSLVRLALAWLVGPGVDESYMIGVARDLAWSYFDHPPIHIWLIHATAWAGGSEDIFILRLPFIVLFAGTCWLMYRLTALCFGERAGLWAVLGLNLAPAFTLSGASWLLPEGPLDFFLLASALCVARLVLVEPAPARPVLLWMAAGALGGLAMLSKYFAAFYFLAVFVFLITVARQRRWLASPAPWLAVVLAVVMFAPVIIWNAQQDWQPMQFHMGRSVGSGSWKIHWFVQSVGGQMLYLLPWMAVPMAFVLGRALIGGPKAPREWFFALAAIGPVGFFTLDSLLNRGLPHWPMPGWLFVFPLLGAWAGRVDASRFKRWLRFNAATSALALVAVLGLLSVQARFDVLGRAAPRVFAKGDPTLMLFDWKPLREKIMARGLTPQQTPLVVTLRWIQAGRVNYALGPDFKTICLCVGARQFDYINDPADFAGKDALIIASEELMAARLGDAAAHFAATEELEPVVLERAGRPVERLRVVRASGFRPGP